MADVGGLFLAVDSGPPPDVWWKPFLVIPLLLAAVFVYLAIREQTRRSKRVAMGVLAIAAIGAAEWGFQVANSPFDDPSFGFCTSSDPNLPASVAADTILEPCGSRDTISVSRSETVALALQYNWNVDVGTEWTSLSVSEPNVLIGVGSPSTAQGPANSGLTYDVGLYRAAAPGEATISAVLQDCNLNFHSCDRGDLYKVTIQVR